MQHNTLAAGRWKHNNGTESLTHIDDSKHLDPDTLPKRTFRMTSINSLYAAFSELATATYEGSRPPTAEDVARAEAALGRSIPKEFVDLQSAFHDRHPPFWDVLRVQPQGAPPVSEDIVKINLDRRRMYPGELDHVLLFYHAGQGNYDCFIFDSRGQVLGIGHWDPFDDDRETPPDIRYDSWVAWLTDEIQDL